MNQIINELYKKNKLQKDEMRVRRDGDVEKGVFYLLGRASRG